MTTQIQAEHVKPGDLIAIGYDQALEVTDIKPFTTADGFQAFTYIGKTGLSVWNRSGETLIKLN